jgi:signal transduction histidine kinase
MTLGGTFRRLRDAAVYSATSLVTGLACLLTIPVLLLSGVLCLLQVGVVILPPQLRWLGRWTDFERRRAGNRLGRTIPGHEVRPRRLRQLLAERGTRRDLHWLPAGGFLGTLHGLVGFALTVLPLGALFSAGFWWVFPAGEPATVVGVPLDSWGAALGLGLPQALVVTVLAVVLLPKVADGSAKISARLLARSERDELSERVETLQVSRAGAVDAHGAELRRIERDLHDGTQARLVSIAMRLGLAERELDRDPRAVATLLAEARTGAEDAMTELRGVLRTMYPPILADRGLEGALSAVSARSVVPVELSVGELDQIAAPIESAAYFVVTEALTNVAKHSGATSVRVTVTRDVDVLLAEIVDDGCGGVDEALGTGVSGMRRRLAALDGTLKVTSPLGGPTRILLEVSCGS